MLSLPLPGPLESLCCLLSDTSPDWLVSKTLVAESKKPQVNFVWCLGLSSEVRGRFPFSRPIVLPHDSIFLLCGGQPPIPETLTENPGETTNSEQVVSHTRLSSPAPKAAPTHCISPEVLRILPKLFSGVLLRVTLS